MANKYWVGNGTNWSSTASWSLTSGGVPGAAIATIADVPIFDTNSGNAVVDNSGSNQTLFYGQVIFATYSNTITMNNPIWGNFYFSGGNVVNTAGTYSLVPRAGGAATIAGDINSGWNGSIQPFSTPTFDIAGTFSLAEIFLSVNTSLNSTTYSLVLTRGYFRNPSLILDGTAKIVFLNGTTWSGIIRNSVDLAGNVSIVNGSWLPTATKVFKYISGNITHTGTFSAAYGSNFDVAVMDANGITFSALIIGSNVAPGYFTLASTVSANIMGFLGYGSAFTNGAVTLHGTGSFVSSKLHLSLPGANGQWPNITSHIPIVSNNMEVLSNYGAFVTGNTNFVSGTISVGNLSIPSNRNFLSTNAALGQGNTNLYLSNGTWSGNGPLQATNTFIVGDYNLIGPNTWTPINGTFNYVNGNVYSEGTFSTIIRGAGAITLDTYGMSFSTLVMSANVNPSFVTINSTLSTTDCYIPPNTNGSTTTFQGAGSLYTEGFLYPSINTNAWAKTWNINTNGMWRLNTLAHSYSTLTLNGAPTISIGSFLVNSSVNGGTRIMLSDGTWSSNNNPLARIYSSIYFNGNYAIRGDVYWQYVTAPSGQAAMTMSYLSGNIDAEGSRLNIGELRAYNFCNMDCGSMSFDAIRFYHVSGGIIKLISDLNTTGTCSLISSSPASPTEFGNAAGSTGTFRTAQFQPAPFSNLAPVGRDWYVGKFLGGNSTTRLQTTTYSIICNNGIELGQCAILGAFTGVNVAYQSVIITGGSVYGTGSSSYLYMQGNMIIRPDAANIDINTFIQFPNGTYKMTYYPGTYSVNVSGGTLDLSSGSGGACTVTTHPIVWNNIQVLPNGNGQATILGNTLSAYGTITIDNFSNGVMPFSFSSIADLNAPTGTILIKTNQTRTYVLPKSHSSVFKWQNTSLAAGITSLTLQGSGLNTGSFIHGTHTATFSTITGAMPIRFVRAGTWSGNYLVTNNVIFDTGASTLKLDTALKYSTGTITYTSGLIDATTNNNTLFVTASAAFNTNGMSWNNVQISTTNSVVAISSTMSISNTLNLVNPTIFTASSGFYTRNLFTVGAFTHSLRRNSIYTVTNSLTLQGLGTASRMGLVSDSTGTFSYFRLLPGATQSVNYVFARDINSSAGRTIRNYRGVQNNTINWLLLPATYTRFKIDGL